MGFPIYDCLQLELNVLSRWRAEDRKEIIGEEWRKISRILDRSGVIFFNVTPFHVTIDSSSKSKPWILLLWVVQVPSDPVDELVSDQHPLVHRDVSLPPWQLIHRGDRGGEPDILNS